MPVDRELVYESVKWVDPKIYRLYLRLRYRGLTPEEIEKDIESYHKLKLVILTNARDTDERSFGQVRRGRSH